MPPGVKEVDIGWKHGTLVVGTKNWVLCNYCPNVAKGGITRHKHHLAGDSTSVCKCLRAPLEVRKLFKDIYEKLKQDKDEKSRIPHFDDEVVDIDDEDEEEDAEVPFLLGKRRIFASKSTLHNKKTKGPLDSHFKPCMETGKKKGYLVGTPEHNLVHKKLRADAVQKFARWMYDAGLAFNAVKYDVVAEAMGVDEPVHVSRRKTAGGLQGAAGPAESSSQGRARARQPHLVDEPEQENDAGVYKELVDIEGEDELVFEVDED